MFQIRAASACGVRHAVQDLGYPGYFATLMGFWYSPARPQFMAVGLLAACRFAEVAVFYTGAQPRHIFTACRSSPAAAAGEEKALIFGLTDETCSLITGTPVPSHCRESDLLSQSPRSQ